MKEKVAKAETYHVLSRIIRNVSFLGSDFKAPVTDYRQ